jgi:succinate dehydrogenase hydrophobic anchor subunit
MKVSIRDSLKQLVDNRYMLVLSSALMALAIIFIIYVCLVIHPTDVQQVTHYTAFGINHFYTDHWYYLFVFAVFGLFVAALHIIIGLKILIIKGPSLALMFLWLGIAVILIAWFTIANIYNIDSGVFGPN